MIKYLLLILIFFPSLCFGATYNLNLAWDAPTIGGDIDGYQLWYKTAAGEYSFDNIVDISEGLEGTITIDKYIEYKFKCLAYNDVYLNSATVLMFNEGGESADTIDTYRDYNNGIHDGIGDAAVLTDSGEAWAADAFISNIIWNKTDDSYCVITDNDETTITCTLSGGTDNDWDVDDGYAILTKYDLLEIRTIILPDSITVTNSTNNNGTFDTYDADSSGEFDDTFTLDASEILTTEADAAGVNIAFSTTNYDFEIEPSLTDFTDNDPDRDTIGIGSTYAYASEISSILIIVDGTVSNDGTYIADTVTEDLITLNSSEDLTAEGFIEIDADTTLILRCVGEFSNEVDYEFLSSWDTTVSIPSKFHCGNTLIKQNMNAKRMKRR